MPRELTTAVSEVLGLMPWVTGPIARIYRMAGHEIPTKCEAEQAFVMHRCLTFAIEHGDRWRDAAQADLDTMKARIRATEDGSRHPSASDGEGAAGSDLNQTSANRPEKPE